MCKNLKRFSPCKALAQRFTIQQKIWFQYEKVCGNSTANKTHHTVCHPERVSYKVIQFNKKEMLSAWQKGVNSKNNKTHLNVCHPERGLTQSFTIQTKKEMLSAWQDCSDFLLAMKTDLR